MKRLYFDMDGTLADLYGVPDWLSMLRTYNPLPYRTAGELVSLARLECICNELVKLGWEIGVITWLSKDATEDYDEQVISAKMDWIGDRMPYLSDFIAVPYGTPKQKVAKRCGEMWLVDDSEEVRKMWDTPKQRKSIDANGDIIQALRELLEKERGQ